MAAARSGSLPCTAALLAAGSDATLVDAQRRSALHWAAACGGGDLCEALLAADPPSPIMLADRAGDLPLHLAVREDNLSAVAALLLHSPREQCRWQNAVGASPADLARAASAAVAELVGKAS